MLDYFAVGGIAFGLAYWIAGTGLALWRSIVGALLGFLVGWVGGTVLIAALLSAAADVSLNSFDKVIGRNFWFGVAGAWYGVYRARKKLKSVNAAIGNASHEATTAKPTTNDAFADALAEIEENRIDKGTWARCYALSDGNESRAKAAYIKARAEALGAATVWTKTRPSELDGNDLKIASTTSNVVGKDKTPSGSFPKWLVQAAVGLAVIGVLLGITLPAYDDYTKRQAGASAPVQTPAQQETPGKQGEAESSEFASLRQKVGTISTRIERGELPSMDGIALALAPSGYVSGSTAEGQLLESTQTWWSSGDKNHIHIRNITANPLGAVTLEYSESACAQRTAVTRFFLIFTNSIPAGGEGVIHFEYSLNLGKTFPSCLTIISPLQSGSEQSTTKASPVASVQGAATNPGVQYSPPPPSKADIAAAKNYEMQERAKASRELADLEEVSARAVREFPYLDTPEGKPVLDKIVARRNELIQEGTSPALALTRAVNQYAAAYAPQPLEKRATVVVPVKPPQNQGTDASGCRWVTPQQWSCN